MSTLEWNKIIASVLTAGVVAMLSGFIAEVLFHREPLEENAYKIAVAEEGPAEATQVASAPALEPVVPLLAEADPAAGEQVAKKCAACHSFEEGGPNKVGPNLWNVVGRPIGGHEGFSYSDALTQHEAETWTYQNLNAFLHDPQDFAAGTRMTFAGISSVEDRADLIAYLRTLSNSPEPLPSAEEVAAAAGPAEESGEAEAAAGEQGGEETQQAAAEAGGLGPMIAAASPEEGEKVARKCAACHSFEEGGPNKVGPNLFGVIGNDIASHEGFSYSDALSQMEGEWTYQKLSEFLADPRGFAQGTRMTFAGLKKQEDRAAILAYMRSLDPDAPPLPE